MCGFGLQATMKLANAPAAGEVVHPQCATQRASDLLRHHTVFRKDGNHEGEQLY